MQNTIKLLSFFITFLACLCSQAQGIVINMKDGSTVSIPYEDLDSIRTYVTEDDIEPEPEILSKTFEVKGVKFNMMLVKAGTFIMGNTTEEPDYSGAKPAHEVTLTIDYYVGETEVTQALWKAVLGTTPMSGANQWNASYGLGDNYPAYNISYNDVKSFLSRLNAITGEKFRMPTEAEWEFAARGGIRNQGTLYSGSDTPEDVAWTSANSESTTHEVKSKNPNELEIYDMSGNVAEWCSDYYGSYSDESVTNPQGYPTGYERINRGGSFQWSIDSSRVYTRNAYAPDGRFVGYGFRLALTR